MKQFAYPAVCYADNENETMTLLLPDTDIIASGDNVEEAFWSAKSHLKSYVDWAIKFGDEVPTATTFGDTEKLNPKKAVLLIDAESSAQKADFEAAQQRFQNILSDYFD